MCSTYSDQCAAANIEPCEAANAAFNAVKFSTAPSSNQQADPCYHAGPSISDRTPIYYQSEPYNAYRHTRTGNANFSLKSAAEPSCLLLKKPKKSNNIKHRSSQPSTKARVKPLSVSKRNKIIELFGPSSDDDKPQKNRRNAKNKNNDVQSKWSCYIFGKKSKF